MCIFCPAIGCKFELPDAFFTIQVSRYILNTTCEKMRAACPSLPVLLQCTFKHKK